MLIDLHSSKIRLFTLTAALVFSSAALAGFVLAYEIKVENPILTPVPIPTPEVHFKSAIERGIKILSESPPLLIQRGRINGILVDRKQLALAIYNTETDEVVERRFWLDNNQLQVFEHSGIVTPMPVTDADAMPLQIRHWNGFNSYFSFEGHPELVVVANKYALTNSALGSLANKSVLKRDKSKNNMTDIIYVPFSEPLRTQEMVNAGKQHLDEIVDKAIRELDAANIIAQSSPGTPITKAFSPELIKSVLLIEHIDPSEFLIAADNGRALAERTLTIIGANGYTAYRYTGSSAGANGMAQFIKSTYDAMVAAYPKARLIRDYRLGMADHVNAVKAMYLFFDVHKKDLDKRISDRFIASELSKDENILVASYNAGTGRVANSINKLGLNWFAGQLLSVTPILREETLTYVQKFQAIRSLRIL